MSQTTLRPKVMDELEKFLQDSLSTTFSTMLSLPTAGEAPVAFSSDQRVVAASVGFIGEVTGVVYIYVAESFAVQITSKLLGLSEAEIDGHEMVNDTMGEMGNMIVGHMKSCLCDTGRKCVLTIPSIVRGQNFNVESTTSTLTRRVGFQCQDHHLIVEILIKSTE